MKKIRKSRGKAE